MTNTVDFEALEDELAAEDPRWPSHFTCEACDRDLCSHLGGACEGHEGPVRVDGLRFCAACAERCRADLAADIARDWDAAILEDAARTRALEAEEETTDIPRETMQAVVNGGLR